MNDNDRIIMMLQNLNQRFDQHALETQTKLDELKRGLHGEENNGNPGIIKSHAAHDKRIASLENYQKKVTYFGSGFVVALQAFSFGIYEFFKK